MKIFISQLMKGRSQDQIFEERNMIIGKLEKNLGDKFEVIDTYNPGPGSPVERLGIAIQQMADADAVVFGPRALVDGRGCLVEFAVAKLYDIPIINY